MRKRIIVGGMLFLLLSGGTFALLWSTGWIGAVEVPIGSQAQLKVPATLSVIDTGSLVNPLQIQDKNAVIGGINRHEASTFFAEYSSNKNFDEAKALCTLLGVSVPEDAAMTAGDTPYGDLEMTLSYPDKSEVFHYFFFQENENIVLDVWANSKYVNSPFGLRFEDKGTAHPS